MQKTLLFALCASVLVLTGCTKPTQGNTNTQPVPTGATVEQPAPDQAAAPDKDYTAFATCLKEKKLKMYGTERCPHCKNQKAMFGAAFASADYTDCDASRQACIDAGVQGFPTWVDAAGNKYPGTQTMEKLAEIAGCSLDGAAAAVANPTAEAGTADTAAMETGTANTATGA